MRLRDVGEFGLIDQIEALAASVTGDRVKLGIGDDAALVRVRAGEELVVTSDAHVESVHFRWRDESARRIGRQALVANLSDLAAMGARPAGFTLSLAAPPRLEVRVVLDMVRGMLSAGVPLLGGNVTRARETSLHITALGTVRSGRALLRSAARPGDRLLVTGQLGAAAWARRRAAGSGRLRHRSEARIEAGRALAGLPGRGACIDVSDGFVADLQHLLDASGVGAHVDFSALPRPRGFSASCRRLRVRPERLLLAGGEDYELLFTVRPQAASATRLAARLGVPVTELGTISAGPPRIHWRSLPGGIEPKLAGSGWRHF
ncbi:MAG: thiamine-phosphate kinase [Myxococcales bacterium]|nr:thiamine-phosphate kinase [Myxococcales bacterium]